MSQNKYPLCHSLGLKAWHHSGITHNWICADDLEAILQKSTVVYGSNIDQWYFDETKVDNDTHSALLIGIKPIKEKTLTEKISEAIEDKFIGADALKSKIKKLIEENKDESI